MVAQRKPPLAFQEYNSAYPHQKYTLGYAGRPGKTITTHSLHVYAVLYYIHTDIYYTAIHCTVSTIYTGGPEFYISIEDNTKNHGPGSQGSNVEADSCFGKLLINSIDDNINTVKRIQKQPGGTPPYGFIEKPINFIDIVDMKLKVNTL